MEKVVLMIAVAFCVLDVSSQMQDEFTAIGVKLAVISTDELDSLYEWMQLMEDILLVSGQ